MEGYQIYLLSESFAFNINLAIAFIISFIAYKPRKGLVWKCLVIGGASLVIAALTAIISIANNPVDPGISVIITATSITLMIAISCFLFYDKSIPETIFCALLSLSVFFLYESVTDLIHETFRHYDTEFVFATFELFMPYIAMMIISASVFFSFFNIRNKEKRIFISFRLLIIFFIGLVLNYLLMSLLSKLKNVGFEAYIDLAIITIIYSVSILVLFVVLINIFGRLYENTIMQKMWAEERKAYEISKENIELINIKYHDLKHVYSYLKDTGSVGDEYLKDLEKALLSHDQLVDTGSKVLNMLIYEKKQECQNKNISFTILIESKFNDYLDHVECYSLFRNAFDNAIQYLNKVKDVDKRFISLVLTEHNELGMIAFRIQNYYEGKMELSDGLPITHSKGPNHGYGMKSIRHIVKKYNGHFSFKTENNLFMLQILLPLEKDKC